MSAAGWTETETLAANRLIELALAEDLDLAGDVTSRATIPADHLGQAKFVCRAPGVIAGLPLLPLLAQSVDPALMVRPMIDDGAAVAAATTIADVAGPARSILVFERTALNFLQRLSGIATLTRQYVEAAGPAQVFDTRKTTPGWRVLEKYAVRMGGGQNHRMGLFDAILIKDNHLAALGGGAQAVRDAVAAARSLSSELTVEIEVDSVELCEAALAVRPDIILLDNMSPKILRQCAQRRDAVAPEVKLEASGGVTLNTIAEIAATGVDRISVGALTHSAPALDIALDFSADAELGIAG
mgnify:CR=1 FL=1